MYKLSRHTGFVPHSDKQILLVENYLNTQLTDTKRKNTFSEATVIFANH